MYEDLWHPENHHGFSIELWDCDDDRFMSIFNSIKEVMPENATRDLRIKDGVGQCGPKLTAIRSLLRRLDYGRLFMNVETVAYHGHHLAVLEQLLEGEASPEISSTGILLPRFKNLQLLRLLSYCRNLGKSHYSIQPSDCIECGHAFSQLIALLQRRKRLGVPLDSVHIDRNPELGQFDELEESSKTRLLEAVPKPYTVPVEYVQCRTR